MNSSDIESPRKVVKLLAYLALVLVVIIAASFIFKSISNKAKHQSSNKSSSSSANNISVGQPTKQYTSDNTNVGFNYPNFWTIVDTPGSSVLTAISPGMELVNPSGKDITGKIVLNVSSTTPQSLSAFSGGPAVAALESQIINYSNPTADQQGSTYISFLNYANSSSSATGINGVYLTGNSGYTVGQDIPESDVLAVSPLIYLSFISCSNLACTGTTQPTSIQTHLWQEKSFSGPLLKMLESLSID